MELRIYTKEGCHLCDDAISILEDVGSEIAITIREIYVGSDPALYERYGAEVPVVVSTVGRELKWPFDAEDVRMLIATSIVLESSEAQRPKPVTGLTRDVVIFLDRAIYALAKHWLLVINILIGVYAGLPVLAPWLLVNGHADAANLIYAAYRPACHQLPSRSFFIFGQQMAYCERDTAIYTTMLVGGMIFYLMRLANYRLKPLSFKGFIILCIPMAIDGGTQLIRLRPSTWWLRLITGFLFGLGTVWLAYPYLEESFTEIRESLEEKLSF